MLMVQEKLVASIQQFVEQAAGLFPEPGQVGREVGGGGWAQAAAQFVQAMGVARQFVDGAVVDNAQAHEATAHEGMGFAQLRRLQRGQQAHHLQPFQGAEGIGTEAAR